MTDTLHLLAFTVVSYNHLYYAKTFADSLQQHHPEIKICICLSGSIPEGYLTEETLIKAEIITPGVLEDQRLQTRADIYSVVELCCAYKPFYAAHLLEKYNPQQIVYFDADIKLFSRMNGLAAMLQQSNFLLTPHILSPLPNDDLKPNEREILKSGLYNAGFWAANYSAETTALLHWWKERELKYGFYDFERGMGVDQLWLNLAPIFFRNTGIIDHKGYNVAYWNIHERPVTHESGQLMVSETEPLVFYHFSGLDLTGETISYHQNRYTTLDDVLQGLVDDYKQLVLHNKSLFPPEEPAVPVPEPVVELPPPPKPFWKKLFDKANRC
jgi:hypothetical protein